MPLTRTTLLGGPAAATFNGHTFFAYDGILVTPALDISSPADEVDSDANGPLDLTVSGTPVTIKFTPSAPFVDLIALYPWLEGKPGTPLFGPTNTPLELIAANGVRLTFASAALIAMPDLHCSTRGPVPGAVTFLALGASSSPLTAVNRMVTIDTAAVPLPPPGTPQLADDFTVTWGGAPWINLRSRQGIDLSFRLQVRPVKSDANALLDLTLEGLTVEVRFAPASPESPDEADLIAALVLQGATALPGRSLAATAETLEVAGEHLRIELPLAQLISGGMAFEAMRPRIGELVFVAQRAWMGSGQALALANLTEGMR